MRITLKRDIEGNDAKIQTIASRKVQFEQMRDTVNSYLTGLDVPFVSFPFDRIFYDQCIENMVNRGWSESQQAAVRIFLHVGVVMARTAYTHISHHTQIFIAIYTSLVTYLDDICVKEDIALLKSFSKVLLEERTHGHEVLDVVVEILREIPQHYGDLTGSLILSATLRFITSSVMEQEVSQACKSTRNPSTKFPRYLRELSGIPETYIMFAFPPSIPYTVYAQVIPDMTITINFGNDILSLYKEELTGDESNQVSLLASSEKVSKTKIHKQFMEEALKADKSILGILDGNQEALNAYMFFRAGYIAFHTCLKRYRIRELLDL